MQQGRSLIRIIIKYRGLKGFTKYSKRTCIGYTCRQGIPEAGPANFRERKPYWVVLTEAT